MACCCVRGLLLLAVLSALHGVHVVQVVEAQLTEPGICPFSTPLAEWSEDQFVSEPWYEIKAFPLPGLHDALPALRPACTRWHFTPSQDGQGLHARLAYRAGEGDAVVHAFAHYTAKEKYPRFNLTFHDLVGSGPTRSVDMKLVATDYDDFALLWGCSEPNLFERRVVSWVLSRRPFLSEAAQQALSSLFRRHDIRAEKFAVTAHEDCGFPAAAVQFTDVTALPDLREHSQGSVFAPFRNTAVDASLMDSPLMDSPLMDSPLMDSPLMDSPVMDRPRDSPHPDLRSSARDLGESPVHLGEGGAVSWSYIGSTAGGDESWYLSSQGVLVAVLLAFAAVSLVASMFTFRALLQRRTVPTKPVLPVRRQDLGLDVSVATLGSGVDYSRFGGLGQGLVQTRKYAADPCHPRT